MKKLLFTLFLFGFSFFGFLAILHLNGSVSKARAVEITLSPENPDENEPTVTITISGLVPGGADSEDYGLCFSLDCMSRSNNQDFLVGTHRILPDVNGEIAVTVCGAGKTVLKTTCEGNNWFHAHEGSYIVAVYDPEDHSEPLAARNFKFAHAYPEPPIFSTLTPTPSDNLTMEVCGNRHPAGKDSRNIIDFDFTGPGDPTDPSDDFDIPEGGCNTATLGRLNTGDYTLTLRWKSEDFILYSFGIHVRDDGSGTILGGKNESVPGGIIEKLTVRFDPACGELGGPACPTEFATPIGIISADAAGFASKFLGFGIGISGGIAFLLMIFGAYRLMFAGGNPDAIQQGREIITAAIAGLIVIVFAVFILSFIGFTILGLGSL